jgi:cellulose synthase/poly-beta-1,6-N-acetylglucosamine synthase-like glycosyltransferase
MKLKQPFFSIIIPTYNRPEQLTICLQSLVCLDYPRSRFEVIVVDDGSSTPLENIVGPFCDKFQVILLKQRHAGPAAARNTGAARAKGEFFAFTDDDCIPAPDWLQALAARFATFPGHAIGGRTLNALPHNLYSTASQVIIEAVYAYYNTHPSPMRFFATNNLALPADRFHAIGGFDATFLTSEDRELCNRWMYHGYPLTYASEALVYHAHMLTFGTFWWQHFNYGRGAFHFHRTRARLHQEPMKLEPKSFYLNMLRYPFLHRQGRVAWLLTALVVMSQGASAAGFFWEKALQAIKKKEEKIS